MEMQISLVWSRVWQENQHSEMVRVKWGWGWNLVGLQAMVNLSS